MEPKDSEFVFSTPRANESQKKGKEEELTPNSNSNKRKMSSLPNGSSSNEISRGPSNLAIGRSKKKIFSCNYCTQTFFSSQALGGHQNSHKEERALAKAQKKMSLGRCGYGPDGFYPNENMGYFSNQNSMIPRFPAPNLVPSALSLLEWNVPRFPAPNLAPSGLNLLGWNVPRFPAPNLAPSGLSLFGWNGPRFNPPSPNAFFPKQNTAIVADYAIKEDPCIVGSNSEATINGIDDRLKGDDEKREEPLDLSLKL